MIELLVILNVIATGWILWVHRDEMFPGDNFESNEN